MSVTGSCLCGAVRYRVTGPLRPVIACHCKQCRKTSGHHVAATTAPRENVAVSGTPARYAASAEARRGFCGVCGSDLFRDGPGSHVSIFAGSLDGYPWVRLAGHVFCADKGAGCEIAGGLPQADGMDAGMTTRAGGA